MVKKKVRSWLIFWFCNVLDRIFSFVYVKEFYNKKKFWIYLVYCWKVFPNFFYCLHNIYRGSSIDFIAFGRVLEVQERPRKASACWASFMLRQGFS